MAHYEIEIKSLLGTKDVADALLEKMMGMDSEMKVTGTNSQLNHYFINGNVEKLYTALKPFFTADKQKKFEEILEKGKDFSIRSRQKDGEVLLVIKAALDGGTSANAVSRLEFEESLPITLTELDTHLEQSDFSCQAKWSRDRVEYAYKGVTVCFDKNAGYGYLAEFETVTEDESSLPAVREKLVSLMAELEIEELPQDRLARMFAYYNEFWPDYYGTDKTFTIQ